jgi:hypothetical protein
VEVVQLHQPAQVRAAVPAATSFGTFASPKSGYMCVCAAAAATALRQHASDDRA